MADLERKINPRAHRAGLRRLSERANAFSERSIASPSSSSPSCSSSFADFGQQLVDHLRAAGVSLSPGLRDHEFERIEALLGFSFPPDLRAILARGVPSGLGFPDWRSASPLALARWIAIPSAEVCQQVEESGFWCPRQWGALPSGMLQDAARRAARYRLRMSPAMVPVFGLFFVPASPPRAGNPLFFVRRGSIVCCGGGIAEFVRCAFAPRADLHLDREEDDQELGFPFVMELEDQEEEEGGEGSRRWSTSVVETEPRAAMFLEERSRSLPSRGAIEDEAESWGRSLDALASKGGADALGRIKSKNANASKNRDKIEEAARRASFGLESAWRASCAKSAAAPLGTRWDRIVASNLAALAESHRQDSSSKPGSAGVRRIAFWSDAAERMIKQQQQQQQRSEERSSAVEFSLSMCLAPAPASSDLPHRHRRTISSAAVLDHDLRARAPAPAIPEASIRGGATINERITAILATDDSAGPGDGSRLQFASAHLSDLLQDVATRLRRAGWKEEDIAEMVDGASSPGSLLDRSSKLEWIDSRSLQAAGFNMQELSETLCFDLAVECR